MGLKSLDVTGFKKPGRSCTITLRHENKSKILYQGTLKTTIPSSNPVISFARNHPYLTGIGLFSVASAAAYALYSNNLDQNTKEIVNNSVMQIFRGKGG